MDFDKEAGDVVAVGDCSGCGGFGFEEHTCRTEDGKAYPILRCLACGMERPKLIPCERCGNPMAANPRNRYCVRCVGEVGWWEGAI